MMPVSQSSELPLWKKGTRNGMVTDIDGNYVIKVKRNAQLTISYLGYACSGSSCRNFKSGFEI